MRRGTPGFVGARLREAREARGMSAVTLADILGVTRQAVHQYEAGGHTPHPATMERIANALNLPILYFYRPLSDRAPRVMHFRKFSSATKAACTRSASRFDWLRDIVDWVTEFIELPAVNVPLFDVPQDPALLSFERVEELATATRRHWGLQDGPISNVVRLLERNGVVVASGAVDANIDAFATWDAGVPFVFLGTEKESACRSRLDACHELGHLVLHRHVPEQLAMRPDVHALMEKQVNRFAGAFLLPESSFARDLHSTTLDSFLALKPKWLVSIGAMVYRAGDLGFISGEHLRRLWVTRSRLGWNKREPLDDVLTVEQPQLLRRSMELIVTEGLATKQDILSQLPFSQRDIEELAGLPAQSLDDTPEDLGPNVIRLQPKR